MGKRYFIFVWQEKIMLKEEKKFCNKQREIGTGNIMEEILLNQHSSTVM